MKQKDLEIIEFCNYCKDEIISGQNYVFFNGQFYHLNCFLLDHNLSLELDEGEVESE